MAVLQNGTLESLLTKGKEEEKKYKWLLAAELYKRASESFLEAKDFLKTAESQERIGYCFFRAALQAETNEQFRRMMALSVENYGRMVSPLRRLSGEEARIDHSKAMVAYTSSWIETDFSKMATLLDKWWALENKVLSIYETKRDLLAIGRICNNLLEGSADRRLFFSSKEYEQRRKELASLGEKGIAALSQVHDNYELARAYSWTAFIYGLLWEGYAAKENKKKWLVYSEKALSLSEETKDAWLIGWAYNARWIGSLYQQFGFEYVLKCAKNHAKQGRIARDNYMITIGTWSSGLALILGAELEEDPDRERRSLTEAMNLSQEAMKRSQIISFPIGILLSQNIYVDSVSRLAALESRLKEKHALLGKAVEIGRKSFEYISRVNAQGQSWTHIQYPMDALSKALFWLSKTEKRSKEKRQLLEGALKYRKAAITFLRENMPQVLELDTWAFFHMGMIQYELARVEATKREKLKLFNKAIVSFEDSLKEVETTSKRRPTTILGNKLRGSCFLSIGNISVEIYSLTEEKRAFSTALMAYNDSAEYFRIAGLPTYAAESNWKAAMLHDKMGEYTEAAGKYESAANEYDNAARKTPQLKDLYKNHALYLQAWNQIEQARYYHSIEEYDKAKRNYEESAKLHELTEPWSYLASNYFAWANIEEAEGLSRKENTQQAKAIFQKALEQFTIAENSIKQKGGELTSPEETELNQRLLDSSDHRRKYCQARILLEDAKLMDREGKYLQSSKSYEEAALNILAIVEKVESETERKEMEYLAILCHAWEKMSLAEGKSSPEVFLEAAELFEEAKQRSFTEKTSLWALANSSFCKGLAAKNQFQSTFEKSYHSMAKKHVEQAADYYRRAGFETASEYAKATQRLLDAYVYINGAQEEVDPEKKTKYYQLAEQLLQIAAGSFMRAKQPEKTAQVQQIIKTVREEKALAVSLSEVMHAPIIASSTMSFTASSSTSEVSVGLEQFQHANVQANLIAGMKEVKVGESFCLSVEFVNAGKEPALLTRVEDFVPPDFVVVEKPEIYRLEDSCLNMKGKQIAPLKLVEAKVVLQPSRKGLYRLSPKVHYLDELGQNRSLQLKCVEIKVEEVVLVDRVSTGTRELDSLLLGGIPKEYAVVLTGFPSDERELIIRNFLEAGTDEGQPSFYVATEAVGLENLLKMSGFFLFLCNPKPKVEVPDLPNITRLMSKTDLNNLNMALVRASRNVQQKQTPKRVIIENVSDVLLKDGPEVTRRWLSELMTELTSKGFTMLAVINPEMHPSDQTGALLDLFDGEISITQTGDPLECKKQIQVKKLRGQDYIKNPICLVGRLS